MTSPLPEGVPGPRIVVVGAHLSGLPLNHQLTDLDAVLVSTARTQPVYRLFVLPETNPPKPGMLKVGPSDGAAIDVEIWQMGYDQFGRFVDMIPAPLGIGTISLDSGEEIKGFLVEQYATIGATDISSHGGWRPYISTLAEQAT